GVASVRRSANELGRVIGRRFTGGSPLRYLAARTTGRALSIARSTRAIGGPGFARRRARAARRARTAGRALVRRSSRASARRVATPDLASRGRQGSRGSRAGHAAVVLGAVAHGDISPSARGARTSLRVGVQPRPGPAPGRRAYAECRDTRPEVR